MVADLATMPHLLIAGTTGSGKSVCITAAAACLVANNTPDDLRLIMIDPKMVELVRFNGLPHLYGHVEVELDRILDYSASVQYVGVFGHAVGKVVGNQDEDERVLGTALARKPLNEGFVVGYAMGRVEVAGREWVSKQAGRLQRGGSTPEALALLYLGVPEDRSTWAEVAGHGPAVESAYWKRARGRS